MPHKLYKAPPGTENASLLEAMGDDALANDWQSRRRVYQELLKAVLLVPVLALPPNCQSGTLIEDAATQVAFGTGRKDTGEKITGVFTDEEVLRSYHASQPFVRVQTRSLFRIMRDAGVDEIYVNLFRGHQPVRPGGLVTRREFDSLADGMIPEARGLHHDEMRVTDDGVSIQSPVQTLSPQATDALTHSARKTPEVEEIFLFRLSVNNGPARHAIGIGLAATTASRAEIIIRQLMTDVQPQLGKGDSLDVIQLQGPHEAEIRKHGILLYQRSRSM